jgi:N-carbamoyl-L-amino-acid hydrolase
MYMNKETVNTIIEQIAQYGKGNRGASRLAFSDADKAARDYVIDLMRQAGLEVRIDEFGNVIGRLEGTDKNAAAVITGSHLDTVPEGGHYDGVVGVIGGLAAIERLKVQGPHTHPIELIIFAAEESSRFGFATMGSKVMAGITNLVAWAKVKDQSGVTLPQALAANGLSFDSIGNAKRAPETIKAFIELHIEQGAVLERHGETIGIVEAIAAPTRMKMTVEGEAAHSGATPMDDRRDALVSAARIILAVQEIALDHSHRGTVGTVGALKVHPGVMNVVPGQVEMWVDIRGVDHDSIIETLQEIKDVVSDIADEQETPVSIEVMSSEKPVQMHQDVIRTIDDVCRNLDISYRRMNSGAGHDAMNMAYLAPAGMIFIPCRGGISHNPDEFASTDDIMAGIDVLTGALHELAR